MKVDDGRWQAIFANHQGPTISHLLFVDDVLLFCKAKKSHFRVVMETLESFHKMPRLKVSLEKVSISLLPPY